MEPFNPWALAPEKFPKKQTAEDVELKPSRDRSGLMVGYDNVMSEIWKHESNGEISEVGYLEDKYGITIDGIPDGK